MRTVARAERVYGGYAPSATFRIRLADGRRAFVKGIYPLTKDSAVKWDLENEERIYQECAPFMRPWAPEYHGGAKAEGWHVMVLEDVGPMRAIYLSYRVVRRNVWPTAGFITLTILISRGIPLALTQVIRQPVGVLLAMIAHAYVAAGLATGSLLFYRERRARVSDVRPEHGGD